jgi:dynein heavy chain 1
MKAGLQAQIIAEDKSVERKILEIVGEWDSDKPIKGDIKAENAINTLAIFEGRLTRLKEEFDQLNRAKDALALDVMSVNRLEPVLEELRDLKSVWSSLSKVWVSIGELKDTAWASVMPRKIRQQLDNLVNVLKEMPSRMRQYAAFEYVQDILRGYIKSNTLISDLKSEALRDRHWKSLFKVLRLEGRVSMLQLTIGHLYDADLKKNVHVVFILLYSIGNGSEGCVGRRARRNGA